MEDPERYREVGSAEGLQEEHQVLYLACQFTKTGDSAFLDSNGGNGPSVDNCERPRLGNLVRC